MIGIWHGGDWMKRDLAYPCLQSGSLWKSHNWLAFTSLIRCYFFLLFHDYYTSLYVDYMVFLLGIYVAIMMVMNMYYENGYVWITSCFYL